MKPFPQDALIGSLPLPVLALDAENRIVQMNLAGEEWLSTGAKFAADKPVDFFVRDEGELVALLERVREERRPMALHEHECALRGDRKICASFHVAPLQEHKDWLVMAVVIHKRPQAQPVRAAGDEVMDTAGLMAAMLAHEVKNPLAGIRGAAQLLMQEAGEEHRPLAELICRETDRINAALSQVEPFSEEGVVELEAVNLHEVLRYGREVAEVGFARGMRIIEDYDPSLPEVMASRERLTQVVLNLIKNAAEALEGNANAEIRLRSFYESPSPPTPGAVPIHITVEDNGPGVAEELKTLLFEPFASSKQPGRGLGLAIASKLVRDMNGTLSLEASAPGCTRFRVTLMAV